MAKNIQTVTLDFSGERNGQTLFAKQGDSESRVISVRLLNGGRPFTLSEGESAELRLIKPDRKTVVCNMSAEPDGSLTALLPEDSLSVKGTMRADIAVASADGSVLSCAVFNIKVEPSADSGDYLPSGEGYKRQSDLNMNSRRIVNLGEPQNDTDAATKAYVDSKEFECDIPEITVDGEVSENSKNPVSGSAVARHTDKALGSLDLTLSNGRLQLVSAGRTIGGGVILASGGSAKYSVSFFGSSSEGVRCDSAEGMTAQVAVGDETVQNDFDEIPFYNRPICCCSWDSSERKWTVNAYRGEPEFAWDGSNGEIMYECTPFYYSADFSGEGAPSFVSVTADECEGYQLAPMFRDGETKEYRPVFNMASIGGKGASRAGLFPEYGSLDSFMETARAFDEKAHTEDIETYFSECLLQLVEFATKDFQKIMTGASSLPRGVASFVTEVVSPACFKMKTENAEQFVPGQTVAVGTAENREERTAAAVILSISPESQGNSLVTLETPVSGITEGDLVSSRMYRTGAAALAVTNASSGSPVSNESGKYPCIWRGKENPWSNASSTLCNVLVKRAGEGTDSDPHRYRLCYLPEPSKYSGELTDEYIESEFDMAPADGFVKTVSADSNYPFLIYVSEVGASSNTYAASYYFHPRNRISAVRVGGYFGYGHLCGLFFSCYYAPSYSEECYAARMIVR